MKALALLFAVCALAVSALAAPATLKEVFAQEAAWRIQPPSKDLLSSDWRKAHVKESAAALLARISNGRSDAERKTASFIAQANRAALDPVLAAAAKSAAPSDQAEVARVVAAMR
jgi:hypothetical protein